jgi:hypothetical protein
MAEQVALGVLGAVQPRVRETFIEATAPSPTARTDGRAPWRVARITREGRS